MKKTVFNIFTVLFSALFLSASCGAQSMQEKAEKGDLEAQLTLCTMYHGGIGAKPDKEQASKWCKKAAEGGNAEAQFIVGSNYREKDINQAIAWYKKAADSGNADAQMKLGTIYEYGSKVPKDMAQARSWYQKAAEQGNASAQIKLAYMYYVGKGVARDIEKAKHWNQKAADQGVPSAWKELNEINSEKK